MIRLFFIGLFRNLKKDKVSSIFIFIDLIVGYVVFSSLFLIVNGEYNYDTQNDEYDRIYRVQLRQDDTYPTNYVAYTVPVTRYEVLNDMPEIEKNVLMQETSCNFFTMKDGSQIRQTNGLFSENSFFDIFTVDVLQGDPSDALTRPGTIALSETLAQILFPNANAVGEHLIINKKETVEVTLVYKDFPGRATIRPNYLISLATLEAHNPNFRYFLGWSYTEYVLLKPNANYKDINKKIETSLYERLNSKASPYLHPLSQNHIAPNNQRDILMIMELLTIAAYLIIILSYANFTNLTLASSSLRTKEIGIKKVLGCSRRSMAFQFIIESLIVTYMAMIIGILITIMLTPYLNHIMPTPSRISMDYRLWENPSVLFSIFASGTVIGILAGCYPAFVMASFNPLKIMKGTIISSGKKKIDLKKALLAVQFIISIFMLIVGRYINKQADFMINSDLGFESHDIVYADVEFQNTADFELIRQHLKENPEIVDVTYSRTIPYLNNTGGRLTWEGCQDGEKIDCSTNWVSYGFINTYDLTIKDGRNFSPDYNDKTSCIINETAMKAMGYENPLGKKIDWYGTKYTIIGVVKDFHPFTVHNPIPPYYMFLNENELGHGGCLLSIRHTPGTDDQTKQYATKELSTMFPDEPFVFTSFRVNFDLDLASFFYGIITKVFTLFSIVSLFLSAMGLFALMSFTVKRRIKEIGIKKILGCSVPRLFFNLSKSTFIILIISMIISVPSVTKMREMMPGAVKVQIQVGDILICLFIVILITFLTILFHLIKGVKANPVESLRYE